MFDIILTVNIFNNRKNYQTKNEIGEDRLSTDHLS